MSKRNNVIFENRVAKIFGKIKGEEYIILLDDYNYKEIYDNKIGSIVAIHAAKNRIETYLKFNNNFKLLYNCYQMSLGRFLLKIPKYSKLECDHINQNVFDNRICNLRIVTHSQNNINVKYRKNNKFGFRNISYYKKNTWQASIYYNYTKKHICYNITSIKAAHNVIDYIVKNVPQERWPYMWISDPEKIREPEYDANGFPISTPELVEHNQQASIKLMDYLNLHPEVLQKLNETRGIK
jgi:hypothetical protein